MGKAGRALIGLFPRHAHDRSSAAGVRRMHQRHHVGRADPAAHGHAAARQQECALPSGAPGGHKRQVGWAHRRFRGTVLLVGHVFCSLLNKGRGTVTLKKYKCRIVTELYSTNEQSKWPGGKNTHLNVYCFCIFKGIYLYLQCQVTLND